MVMSWRTGERAGLHRPSGDPAIETIIAGASATSAGSASSGCCLRLRAGVSGRSCSSITWAGALAPGQGIDVRPHPHINLATVTYLFEGEIVHRDSARSLAADPARRDQLDDRRARHRAFRAHQPGIERNRLAAASACSSGSGCRRRRRKSSPNSCTTRRLRSPSCTKTAYAARSRRKAYGAVVTGAHALAAFYVEAMILQEKSCRFRPSTRSAPRMSSKAQFSAGQSASTHRT
jgi:hypothetical protein